MPGGKTRAPGHPVARIWFAVPRGAPVAFAHDPPHVEPVRPHPSRRPQRRGGPEPPAAGPGRLHPPQRARHLHLAAARAAGAAQDREHHPRRDGRHRRPGAAVPRAAAQGALRGERPLDRVRRQHLPPPGPQGRRLPPRPHARGDVHPRRQGPLQLLQGPAALDLPDPDQVPRRGASPRRPAARPRVRHEGLLLLRRRRRRPRGVVPEAPRGLHPDLRPPRLRVRHRQGDLGRDGRLGQRGVPRQGRGRRGHLRPLHALRLRRQRGGRRGPPPGARAVRRRARRARGGRPRTRPTIDTLVDHLNAAYPRDDRPWAAGDTLKNVLVVLKHPDGTREPLAIGVPGDREVDQKRLEGQLEPIEVGGDGRGRAGEAPRAGQGLHRPRGARARSPRPASATSSTPAWSRAPAG